MSSDDQPVEVVITAPDTQWLRQLISELVRQHRCAAGHLSQHETIYYWQGQVHEGTEARGTLYTRASLVPEIAKEAQQKHPYEVPHISATAISDGNPDYLRWILTETGGT